MNTQHTMSETAYLELLEAIAAASNLATTVDEAMSVAVDRVCALMVWPVGHLYLRDKGAPGVMSPTTVWCLDDADRYKAFQVQTEEMSFQVGEGLPGRVAATGQPAWITDVGFDTNFPRRAAALRSGLRSALGFPIVVGTEVVGVLEFFSSQIAEPDKRLMEVMANVGVQLGRVVERHQAVEALRASELRFRSVAEAANDAIITADGTGAIISWNKGATTIFGYSKDEAIGNPLSMLMPSRYRAAHEAGMARVQSTGETRVIGHTVELEGLRKSGDEFPVELSLTTWQEGGETFYSGIIRDATERKEAERRVRELNAELEHRVMERTEQLSRANAELQAEITERKRLEQEREQALAQEKAARERSEDAEARMASLADALDRALAEEELLNAITTDASGEDSLERILASSLGYLSRAINFTGGSIDLVEGDELVVAAAVGPFAESALGQRIPRGHGRSWRVITDREPLLSGNLAADGLKSKSPIVSYLAVPLVWRGEAFGILQIDSTEPDAFTRTDLRLMLKVGRALSGPVELARRYAAERLAVARAEAAIRTRDELLSVVSHDLRNPLSAIMGNINLLRRRLVGAGLEEQEREMVMLARVEGAASRMVALVEELLDFGRLQAGTALSLQLASVDLVALARELVAETGGTTSRHKIILQTEEEQLLGLFDATRIERVLSNLLSNAVKYSPDGGNISVTLRREVVEGAAWAVIEVDDQGVGIPKEELPHIFEWFRRAENVSGRISGAGIGLATSRLTVEQHGGSISVGSREGEGTTFTVRLPLQQSA